MGPGGVSCLVQVSTHSFSDDARQWPQVETRSHHRGDTGQVLVTVNSCTVCLYTHHCTLWAWGSVVSVCSLLIEKINCNIFETSPKEVQRCIFVSDKWDQNSNGCITFFPGSNSDLLAPTKRPIAIKSCNLTYNSFSLNSKLSKFDKCTNSLRHQMLTTSKWLSMNNNYYYSCWIDTVDVHNKMLAHCIENEMNRWTHYKCWLVIEEIIRYAN